MKFRNIMDGHYLPVLQSAASSTEEESAGLEVEEVEEEVEQGQEIGHFSFGSSIVLIFEAPLGLQFTRAPRDEVWLGEYLL